MAAESIDLIDGPSGRWLRRIDTPGYLRQPGGPVRLFERNGLPGDTQVAFRTDVFRAAGGYDPDVVGPESYDLLLRAVRGGARLAFGDTAGYRMHAYPGSVSRQLPRQRAALARALGKHRYEDVRALYEDHGYSPRIAAWALVSMALFRGEPARALAFLAAACPDTANPAEVLEPDGPWPLPEGWRRAFARGTCWLLLGRPAADEELRTADTGYQSAEAANNRGVALWRRGWHDKARRSFELALERRPGYLDALTNLDASDPSAITTHPLRRHAHRVEYSPVREA